MLDDVTILLSLLANRNEHHVLVSGYFVSSPSACRCLRRTASSHFPLLYSSAMYLPFWGNRLQCDLLWKHTQLRVKKKQAEKIVADPPQAAICLINSPQGHATSLTEVNLHSSLTAFFPFLFKQASWTSASFLLPTVTLLSIYTYVIICNWTLIQGLILAML